MNRALPGYFTPLIVILLGGSLAATPVPPHMPLKQVRSFMYQLQNIENPTSVRQLAQSEYDLLVIEPTATVKDQQDFNMKAMVAALHAGKPGRIVLAYLDTGQAESFRTYWNKDWKAPTKTSPAVPDFILAPDPDGWNDDYTVAYWDPRWQSVFATAKDSQVRTVMAAGFDGVYLDWIDAYQDERVVARAKKEHVDPTRAMVDFLLLIRKTAKELDPDALVIQQNALYLLDANPLLDAIDGVGAEDTWFGGKSNAKWGSKKAGDIPNRYKDESSIAGVIKQYQKYLAAGKPVFTIDYCVKPENAKQVYDDAKKAGLIPLVTQVSLDHMTATPPPSAKRIDHDNR